MNPAKLRREHEAAAKARKLAYVADRLVAIREAMGWRQVDLCHHFRVAERTLIRWEREGLRHGPEAVLYSLLERGIWHPDPIRA